MLHASEWAEYMHVRAISRVAPIGCEDKVLRIIDADNGTVLHKVQHGDGVCSVDFHPAGNFIVTGQSQYTPTATNVHLYPKTCQRHTCIHTQRPHACLPTCPHACLHTCPHVDPNSTHTCICHIYPQVHTVYAQDHGAFIDYMMQQRAWLDRLSHQPPSSPTYPTNISAHMSTHMPAQVCAHMCTHVNMPCCTTQAAATGCCRLSMPQLAVSSARSITAAGCEIADLAAAVGTSPLSATSSGARPHTCRCTCLHTGLKDISTPIPMHMSTHMS